MRVLVVQVEQVVVAQGQLAQMVLLAVEEMVVLV